MPEHLNTRTPFSNGVYVPGYHRCWAGRVVERPWIHALLERCPHSRLVSRIFHYLGTYQAILLQRPADRRIGAPAGVMRRSR